ncbi:MAG: HupE/UreJ family protein, partial [Sedimentisphaerales bacterium]|nr:HupE/UreJ family protein [Sedimentisphaerales bacterium]
MKNLIKNCVKKSWLAALGLSLIATPAFAHPGEHTTGFWAGFVHPFTGLDHLVAMMLLGVWFALLT